MINIGYLFVSILFLNRILLVQLTRENLDDLDRPLYKLVSKRDSSSWFYPEIEKDRISCETKIFEKLTSCSQKVECAELANCFELIHCPSNVKSFGGFIYNLLQSLGATNCPIHDENQSCSHEQRRTILKNSIYHWENYRNLDFCNSTSKFFDEIKREIEENCPMHFRQVESFANNYLCSTTSDTTNPTTTMNFIDEDAELDFINYSDQILTNTTEHTIYVNDHQYYNISYIVPTFVDRPRFFIEKTNEFQPIHPLSNRHRSAFGLKLKFSFPFYGHLIDRILIATGGFIYTGDFLHAALIGSTQYVAPFMANFDASLGNDTSIEYFDNGTHFVCTWRKIYLQDQQELGPYTFQVIMQDTGKIYFNYIEIPSTNVSSTKHAFRVGLSDAFLSQHSTNEHILRIITLYDKINLDLNKVQNGVSIVLEMDQICNTFTDCSSCLANRGKRYNCSWCDDIQKCSDGVDRSRQQWIRAQCHRFSSVDFCPNSFDSTFSRKFLNVLTTPKTSKSQDSLSSVGRSSTILQTFRTIFVTLLLSVLILALIVFGGTYLYAYRHPTSVPGMWLIEHRPSTYIARFKRSTITT